MKATLNFIFYTSNTPTNITFFNIDQQQFMQRFPLDTVNGNNTAPIDPNIQNFVGDPYSNMMQQNPSFSLMPSMNSQSYNFSSSPFIPQNTGISSSNQIIGGMNINSMNTTPTISSAKNSSSGKSNFTPLEII